MARVRPETSDETRHHMRRQPIQKRSRSTVAIIKQAALDILAKESLAACGTHRIAERAGLSVGSLYKYFPNREAVLKALYEDASVDYAQLVGKLTLQILELPTQQGMELTMRNVVSMHEKNQLVLLQLATELPELRLEYQPMAFHNLVRTNIRAYVQHRNRGLRPKEIANRCFFIEHTVFSCIQGYVSHPPPSLSHREFARRLAGQIAFIIEA